MITISTWHTAHTWGEEKKKEQSHYYFYEAMPAKISTHMYELCRSHFAIAMDTRTHLLAAFPVAFPRPGSGCAAFAGCDVEIWRLGRGEGRENLICARRSVGVLPEDEMGSPGGFLLAIACLFRLALQLHERTRRSATSVATILLCGLPSHRVAYDEAYDEAYVP